MAKIDVDATEFLRRLNLADARVRDAAYKQMDENRLKLEQEAKALAPVHEGTLLSSGVSTRPIWKGNNLEATSGFNAPYADKVHETMKPAISGERQMEPGELTRAKPPTEFGEAGGKYLERPLLGLAREFTKRIAARIKTRLR